MAEPKTIYCPNCGRKVLFYDGKAKINPVGKCKKCKKLVVYNIKKDETVLKQIPERTQGSGVRFY